jgi:hypothetical protein
MTRARCHTAGLRVVVLVVVSLLAAQWWALHHAVAHHHALAAEHAAGTADEGSTWDHDAGTPTCSLLDHLLTGQALAAHPAVLCTAPQSAGPVAHAKATPAPVEALRPYQARAPPLA